MNKFLSAEQARKNTRDSVVVHNEIRAIESAILTAIDNGDLTTIINDTTMTNSSDYYNVWYNVTVDAARRDQLNYVRQYFVNLNYDINIATDPSNPAQLRWNVSW